jgi:predicted esterase
VLAIRARRGRVLVVVCSWFLPARTATAVEVLEQTAELPGIVLHAPHDGARPRPVTIVLHGMCSEPERICAHFAPLVSRHEWLICPRARSRCPGGGSIWPRKSFERDVELGMERVRALHPGELDESAGRTLVGFSLGAFRALDLAHAAVGRYPRLLLIGARIEPDPVRLRRAGVKRLLLSAGDWDMMNAHMQRRTRSLRRAGFPATFLGLGPVGHAFPADFPVLLERALAWLHAPGPESH